MAGGRPTKLTEEVHTRIVAAIQRGSYIETAAAMAGINKVTFYDWLKQGAKLRESVEKGARIQSPNSTALIEFSNAIERAAAESEIRDLAVIDGAAQNGQWQAAAWKLERKHHARWGRKMALTDEQGGNFFTGMASAWATALEVEEDDDYIIEGELDTTRIEGPVNGNGAG